MASTVTAFYTFTQNTKARSSQVNTNFSNYRGDIIPINTDTNTASDVAHGLGVTDHRWRSLNMGASGSSVNVILKPQESVVNGAVDLLLDTSTIGSWDENGIKRSTFGPVNYAISSLTGTYQFTTSGWVRMSALSQTITSTGKLASISFLGGNDEGWFRTNTISTQTSDFMRLRLVRGASTVVGNISVGHGGQTLNPGVASYTPCSAISFIDNSVPAGTASYHLEALGANAGMSFGYGYVQTVVREL